ncbi:DUF7488 domain-containing protein [Campylobacter canadensis]|uniref:PDZ domain-containing protein n=1 Tax=Campylobacter canadensis TaxID=449520 RepID=A0ABS7WQR2_9BACT|nr:PDZ domain-containing protein [Campylobacter canadensis]MBZ7987083.1 PDZ domain-containing protein [Campylobacter canadensis]MBZ7994697.1 PDZ domain-containing protein [Campylobacter canadensis]MBZ7996193.1 PDZ domain-containing protein [Campylobacter canadensis]MBZ7998119.1 PDZ domain-containing protein [Campylobacter canadensis]MBZ7999991.1 PDZ domain-containing protein [Campylobacter canadensis]
MKKLIFLLSFSFLAYAVERPTFNDFLACYEKNKAAELTYEGLPAFVLDENLLAVVKLANTKLNSYVKYDPFLNLYLVRTDFSLIKPEFGDENEKNRNDWLGILDAKKEYIGHLKYLGLDLSERDKLDFKSKIGLLSSPCCKIIGIALNNGDFIGNRYLNHFKKYNEVYWGDIGASFTQKGDRYFVSSVTTNTSFRINDEILSVDDKPVNSLRELNERVLFAPNQSTIYFKILRDNEEINLSILVSPKIYKQEVLKTVKQVNKAQVYNSLGIILDNNLKVIKSNNANFKIGDVILRVNNILVNNKEHFARLSAMNNPLNILISRHIQDEDKMGDFQFFITINKD